MKIRPARAADTSAIRGLIADWTLGGSIPTGSAGRHPRHERRDSVLVAELDGRVVGLLMGHHGFTGWAVSAEFEGMPSGSVGSLLTQLYVHHHHRRQGVASELVRAFVQEAQELERPVVVVQPDESDGHSPHQGRVSFFLALGFRWLPPGAGLPERRWLMGRSLSSRMTPSA